MIHLQNAGSRESFEIERCQIIAATNGVFLRITTQPSEVAPLLFASIRETPRGVQSRWQVDGLNFNLSCRSVEFVTTNRRPLTTQLLVDVYFPLNQAIDISFQQYTPIEGAFSQEFTNPAPIVQRETAVTPNHAGSGRRRTYRPTPPANIPRQVVELTPIQYYEEDLPNEDARRASTIQPNVPAPEPAVPVEPPEPKPDAQFLRRFDNMVTDDGMEEPNDDKK